MNATTPPPSPPSGSFFTSKPFLILVTIAVLLVGGILLFKSLSSNTTLSFELSLDGKAITANTSPTVQADGQPFTSGNIISLGLHKLIVQLKDAETLERDVWILFGKKNLGTLPLESSKGSLAVTVNPSPAKIILKRSGEVVRDGTAPLSVEKLPVGDYTLVVSRGDYSETHSARIQRQQQTDAKIELKLGGVELSSDPADAEFELSGNGRRWQGKLPTSIADVPVGAYRLDTRRKGWELSADISVGRGITTTNKTEFPYGSIEVTSEPTGLVVSRNGVEIGKTPLTLQEMKPGQYALSATDGENDLMASVTVGPKDAAKHAFAFRYGAVQLASTPAGATVTRKGKEAGKTPLKLERIPAGETAVALKLDGYVTTNFALHVVEGETANLTATLISERYLADLGDARRAAAASPPDYRRALVSINDALQISPDEVEAIQLRKDYEFGLKVSEATELFEKGELDGALAKADAALALKPDVADAVGLKSKITEAKAQRDQLAAAKIEQLSVERAAAVRQSFEQLIANLVKAEEIRPGTYQVFVSKTAAWTFHLTQSQAKDALLRTVGQTPWRRVDSEDTSQPDITVVYLSPKSLIPGIGDRNIFGQKVPSRDHLVVQLCQLPYNTLDVRANRVYGNDDRENAEFLRNAGEGQFREFKLKFHKELTAVSGKPVERASNGGSAPQEHPVQVQAAQSGEAGERKEIVSVIEKAIAAAGGRDVLSRFKAFKVISTSAAARF